MHRYFVTLCSIIIYSLSATTYAENGKTTQSLISTSQQAKITSISLEEHSIVLNNKRYSIHPKIQVSNYENLPLDAGSLSPGQKVEFWTDIQSFNNHLPSGMQNANVIKIRVLSHISQESIYH